tara:strand:+ start:734 stop:1084 length:351 start_codon:yes stop_codon:yes gene_type:complete
MPQHPKYYKDPIKSFEDIQNLISKLVQYGLAHEDVIYPELEYIMSALYSDGESQDYETLEVIWQNCKDGEEDQFIQDLRNALSLVMYSDFTGNYESKIEEVKKNRDLEYYKTNQKL